MRYLTDQPEQTRPLLPADRRWQRCDARSLGEADGRLWRLLAENKPAWQDVAANERGDDAEDDQRVVLISHATGSQFDVLVEALKAGVDLPDRLVCLALTGTGFRGQRSRSWSALPGNAHLTRHDRLTLPARDAEAGLVMLPAVATAAAIGRVSGGRVRPTIKWVNDLLVEGRKVAGVLTSTQVENDRIRHVVFGIGVNIERRPELPKDAALCEAAALTEFDAELRGRLPEMVDALVDQMDHWLNRLRREGVEPLHEAYRSLAGFMGRRVRIWGDPVRDDESPAPLVEGEVQDLRADLSLVIAGADGPVRKGRMELLEAEGPAVRSAAGPDSASRRDQDG